MVFNFWSPSLSMTKLFCRETVVVSFSLSPFIIVFMELPSRKLLSELKDALQLYYNQTTDRHAGKAAVLPLRRSFQLRLFFSGILLKED